MSKTQSVYYPLYNDKEKFIILVTGGRGCERPDQEVIMADMTIRQIKDIKVGDKVMGDDGTPRNVLRTYHGYSEMYRVHQTNAEDYYVNDAHILSIRKGRGIYSEGRYPNKEDKIDINIQEFLKQSKNFRERWYGYKANSIPYKEQPVKIDPYMLGVWLGDGTSVYPRITTPDKEIKDYLQEYVDRNGMVLSLNGKRGKAETLRLKKKGCHDNPFMEKLRFYNLVGNKHIPQEYIANSEEVRLELLAGLLDTDGYMHCNSYEIMQKNEILAKNIKFIADTLGFKTSITEKRATCNGKDCGIVYRIFICGDVWRIPCKVQRKKVYPHKRADWLVSKLTITPIGKGEWCGIHLDGNQRYLHSDGTVSHNSGKSYNTSRFIERLTFEYNPEKKLAHQILYTRFTMVSAAISVIPEFWEKVEVDNTEEYFSKTKTDVVNNMTKARVMFRGIHTSSGNQTAKLKSIQGVTTFVVDEAEEWVSEDEFEKIMLSIRVKGLQNRVIIIMNPCDSNHWVYKRFIKDTHKIEYFDGVPVQISTHPNVLHIHTTYLDNINNLSEQFLKEVLDMKVKNPERYAHIVMGQWADVAEGAVFKKFGIVDEFPDYAKKVARAMDFGYSCFKGDTLIMTKRGEIPIKDIRIGDLVLTRKGYRRVRNKMYNGVKDVITKEITIDGIKHKLSATYEHNINVNGKWKKYGELTEKDKLYVLSHSTESSTRDTQAANTQTTTITNGNARQKNVISRWCVNVAESLSWVINTLNRRDTAKSVLISSHGIEAITVLGEEKCDVFDLEIEGVHEYFANGILVHNCDPTAIVRCGIVGNRLYLDELCYRAGMTSGDIIRELKQEERNGDDGFVYSESADPRLIDEIGLGGVIIYPVQKGNGSILAGLAKMHDMEIYVTKRSVHLQEELRNYVYAKDKDGNYINYPEDHDNHCFVGETMVNTDKGCVRIDSLSVGQRVLTSKGYRRVSRFFDNGVKKTIHLRILLSNGRVIEIEGTPDHKVRTVAGWIQLQHLSKGHAIYVTYKDTIYEEIISQIDVLDKGEKHVYDIEVEEMHEFFANGILVHNCIDASRYYVLAALLGKVMHPKRVTKDDLGVY